MKNKEFIEKAINIIGYKLGCYHNELDNLDKDTLVKVVLSLSKEYTDIPVDIEGLPYIVELTTMDNEKDLQVLTEKEYSARYHPND